MNSPRPRGTLTFDKPPMSNERLVDRLENRGLRIENRERAIRYISHIGYYRLSPYMIPFQTSTKDHAFRTDVSFDDVLGLYVFDRSLRLLVMDVVERIEIAIRSSVTNHMANTYQDSHWYLRPEFFTQKVRSREKLTSHQRLLRDVRVTCSEQLRRKPERDTGENIHKTALEHYLTTYGEPDLPPSWLMIETLSLGQLNYVYKSLKKSSDRTAIATTLGLKSPILESWLGTYTRVRNICAHHGRLWNVGLGLIPKIPQSPDIKWSKVFPETSRKRLYPVIMSMQSILYTVSPSSSWADRLRRLLHDQPPMVLNGMGIPDDWTSDPFWSQAINHTHR